MAPPQRQCKFCPRVFNQAEHLKRHERTHVGAKPFRCKVCQKAYARSDVLARHLRNHPSPTAPSALPDLHSRTEAPPSPQSHSQAGPVPLAEVSPGLSTSPSTAGVLDVAPPTPSPATFTSIQSQVEEAPSEAIDWAAQLLGEMGYANTLGEPDLNTFLAYLDTGRSAVSDAPFEPDDLSVLTPALPLRDSRLVLTEIMRIWPDNWEQPEAQPLITWTDFRRLPQDNVLDTIQKELTGQETSTALSTVVTPSSTFLMTALNCYWRHTHRTLPILHEATFHASDHLSLLLLAMCASGASCMASPKAHGFAASVFDRILHILVKRWSDELSTSKRKDLVIVGLLLCLYGIFQGTRSWLSATISLLGSVIAYARQYHIFDGAECKAFYGAYGSVQTRLELWRSWASAESCSRIANGIINMDAWVHTIARDQHPPIPFGQIQLHFPCDQALFAMPTAEDWAALAGPTLTRPPSLSLAIRHLFGPQPGHQLPATSDSWQHQCLMMAIYCQKRCRWMSTLIDSHSLQDRYDSSTLQALYLWKRWCRPPGHDLRPADYGNDTVWDALCLDFLCDVECMAVAAGRDGHERAIGAANLLMRQWYGTPKARRCLMHSCRIIRLSSDVSTHEANAFHLYTGPMFAALVFLFYSLGAEKEALESFPGMRFESAAPFRLGEDVDMDAVGMAGMGPDGGTHAVPHSPAANFILYGGPCSFDGKETIDRAHVRAGVLLRLASALTSQSAVGLPLGCMVAAMISSWAGFELDVDAIMHVT